jgi:hypothetical protein
VFQWLRDGLGLGYRHTQGYTSGLPLAEHAAALRPDEIGARLEEKADLQRQVAWFTRHLFGRKSERRWREPDAQQLPLAGLLPAGEDPAASPPPPTATVKASQPRTRFAACETPDERSLRFDSSVPGEVRKLPTPEGADLSAADYAGIGEQITSRLAQRPGA